MLDYVDNCDTGEIRKYSESIYVNTQTGGFSFYKEGLYLWFQRLERYKSVRRQLIQVLLTMTLFRNQIRIMLGGETDKITLGRTKYNFSTWSNKNIVKYNIF